MPDPTETTYRYPSEPIFKLLIPPNPVPQIILLKPVEFQFCNTFELNSEGEQMHNKAGAMVVQTGFCTIMCYNNI